MSMNPFRPTLMFAFVAALAGASSTALAQENPAAYEPPPPPPDEDVETPPPPSAQPPPQAPGQRLRRLGPAGAARLRLCPRMARLGGGPACALRASDPPLDRAQSPGQRDCPLRPSGPRLPHLARAPVQRASRRLAPRAQP